MGIGVDDEIGMPLNASLEAKLRELLGYIASTEIKLCSDAAKQFVKQLKGARGDELLRIYLRDSPKCQELLEAWKIHQGKPGIAYIQSLIAALLGHPDGMFSRSDKARFAICRALDDLARLLVEEKLGDVYAALNSKEVKRQKAALELMASVVRRSSDLATEVAKKFEFTLPAFRKLGEFKRKKKVDDKRKNTASARKPFVGFAMSFLEVGRPGLLRWILQQKDMYSGVLRGLEHDDNDTLIYVMSTLRDKVLTEESLVPPGLRSVLFGSVTLEQLISISGRDNGGLASELVHGILVMVCTHPSNGLMPDLKRSTNQLKGNRNRLLGLMKKLRAADNRYHRDLLLGIVRGKPSFGSAYMEEFPYNVEDHASPNWFSAVSLAANVVSSVGEDNPFGFLDSVSHDPPPFDGPDIQNVIKCVCPRPFARTNMNKGLLHSDNLVKSAALRLLLEELRLLDSFICCLDIRSRTLSSWESLKREIQNEVRTWLPDPQVIVKMLSSLGSTLKGESNGKRKESFGDSDLVVPNSYSRKKRKISLEEDADIVVGGITSDTDVDVPDANGVAELGENLDGGQDLTNLYTDIWGFDPSEISVTTARDAEIYMCAKLLEALRIYIHLTPGVLDGSFDLIVNIINSPNSPMNLLSSVLNLLVEYIRWPPGSDIPLRTPAQMCKHLQTLVNLSLFSPLSSIRAQAYRLSVAAMLSTGAFDSNPREVDAWFLFLPVYKSNKVQEIEVLQSFSSRLISFLCGAVSKIGNDLFKFMDLVRCIGSNLKDSKDCALEFSPFAICILQNCLSVIKSGSGTFSLSEKTMISLYVSCTLKYLLQTQVNPQWLSSAILSLMADIAENCSDEDTFSEEFLCEWRPLKSLQLFAKSMLNHQTHHLIASDEKELPADSSYLITLRQTEEVMRRGDTNEISATIKAFSSSIICASPTLILKNFPSIITTSRNFPGVSLFLLSKLFIVNGSLLARLSKLWPDSFSAALKMAASRVGSKCRKDDALVICGEPGGSESHEAAISLFLEDIPFHILFPAVMSFDGLLLLEFSGIESLLLDKICNSAVGCLVPYLRQVLLWVHQMQLSRGDLPSSEIKKLSESCVCLAKTIFSRLFSSNSFPHPPYLMQELAECIFNHPAVTTFLSPTSLYGKRVIAKYMAENFDAFSSWSGHRTGETDFQFLIIVEAASDCLWSFISSQNAETVNERNGLKHFAEVIKSLVQRLLLVLKKGLELVLEMKDVAALLPPYRALLSLIRLVPPFQLFELARWFFDGISDDDVLSSEICEKTLYLMGCQVASCAYESLAIYLQQPVAKQEWFDMFWKAEDGYYDVDIIGEIYFKVLKQIDLFELDFGDACLLKAINAIYRQKSARHLNVHPLSLVLSRVIGDTPLHMLSRCINRTSVTRARILFMIVELSPLQLSIFGHMFSDILLTRDNLAENNEISSLSNEDLLMLLPSALSFLKSIELRYNKHHLQRFRNIPLVYSRILSDGFCQWKNFVSRFSFQEEYAELFPSSMEDLLKLTEDSFLGKAICMLQYHFILNGESVKLKKCLKLFDSILPESASPDELLDYDIGKLGSCSTLELMNVIHAVFGKISLCQMLLFPEWEISKGVKPDRMVSSRIQFICILVNTWQQIVKKSPLGPDNSADGNGTALLSFYNCLEAFVLRSIHMLVTKMRADLIQLQYIPFLEELMRSSLLYRFEDPKTLRTLRSILTIVWDGQLSYYPYLQLLLAHSQFSRTLQSIDGTSESLQLGAFLRPMSSVLRSLMIPNMTQSVLDAEDVKLMTDQQMKKLEVLKLLRTLLHLTKTDSVPMSAKEDGIKSQELLVLLLSSYGASLSEVDLEIYFVIQELESTYGDLANCAETDFTWGNSALKILNERAVHQSLSRDDVNDSGALEQLRKSLVRDNLPINPKLCAATVLSFPYDRVAVTGPPPLDTVNANETDDLPKMGDAERLRRYDPVFIMRFSAHVLSVCFIEPIEFASLGLLAVAFSCLSSPDDGLRKLAYEALVRFKNALERYQKKKDINRLRLLLNFLQNGIEEPWQRLPSVITLFAAEASFVLLDPSHDHYSPLIKLISEANDFRKKRMPLFPDFLWSTAINFKSERLWILRLIYAGLNPDDDVPNGMRNSIFENLLSFYSSAFSDNESRHLILQIIKKAVKFPKISRYLVEQYGLFSWLSSVLSSITGNLSGDDRSFFTGQLVLVLEATNNLIKFINITEWLQNYALEQLTELSSHLLKLLCGNVKWTSKDSFVVELILPIIRSTLKISQKRKMFQPHFTISVEGLYHIYEVVSVYDNMASHRTSKSGLKFLLMNTPQTILNLDQENLKRLVMWAISVAVRLDNTQGRQTTHSSDHIALLLEEKEKPKEFMMLKLLRWITASVIIGRLSQRSLCIDSLSSRALSSGTLQLLLKSIEASRSIGTSLLGSEEFLIDAMLYLQQLLGANCSVLSSVACAVCLLCPNEIEVTGSSLLSRIRCPPEASPAWRWTYYQPWEDPTSKHTTLEKLDENHACQTLLLAVSNIRGRNLRGSQVLSTQDVEKSGVFEWERSLIQEQISDADAEADTGS